MLPVTHTLRGKTRNRPIMQNFKRTGHIRQFQLGMIAIYYSHAIRARGHSSCSYDGRGEMLVCGVTGRCLFIAGRYGSEFLDLCEEILDQVPPLVGVFIVITQELAVRFRWDDGGCTARIEFCEQPIGIERLVGQKSIEGNAIDERFDALHVVRLTGQENEVGQVSERVDQSNDLGSQSAARASNGLILSPPLAPLAFW